MSIKGAIQSKEVNDYGYVRIKVSGTWYGGDKKGDISGEIRSGDIVEFDAFDKTGNNGKVYPQFKFQSLKKVAAAKAGAPVDKGPVASKDEYWQAKEANDQAKEPRISYHAAYERALVLTDLALRNGAFDALSKAKPTLKLEILQAFVADQADHIMGLVYAAKVPKAPSAAEHLNAESSNEDSGEATAGSEEESWS